MSNTLSADSLPVPRFALRHAPSITGLVVVLVAAIILRFHNLGGASLWADEIFSARTSSLPFGPMWVRIVDDVHPPLYYLVLHLWFRVFGPSDVTVRTLSAVLGLLSVAAIGWVAWREYGARRALLAAAFAATTPILVQYSMEGRMYSMLVLFITLALGGALAWHRTSKRAEGVLYTGALTAALFTHYYTLFFWIGIGIAYGGYLLRRERMDRFMAWCGWNAIPLVLFCGWLPILVHQQANNGSQHWLAAMSAPRLLDVPAFIANCFGIHLGRYNLRLGWGIEPSAFDWGILVVALGWMAMLVWRQPGEEAPDEAEEDDHGRMVMLLGACLGTLLMAWIVSQLRNVWAERGLQVAIPALALLMALRITAIRRRGWAAITGALLLASGAVVSWYVRPKVEPWREAARALRKEIRWGETVAVTAPWTHECLTYYGIRRSQVLPVDAGLLEARQRDALKAAGNSHQCLWLVVNRADGSRIDEFLRQACGKVRVQQRRFGGILLTKYQKPSAAAPGSDLLNGQSTAQTQDSQRHD